jgi:hypothetical protein
MAPCLPCRRSWVLPLIPLVVALWWLLWPAPAVAADLQLSEVTIAACPADDPGSQPGGSRSSSASCYALRGVVTNRGRRPVVDTDVFAVILDAGGEPVLPHRGRIGSLGDVPPGSSRFALRLAVPAGSRTPLQVRNAKARGFTAPVRSRVTAGQERLPLEMALEESPPTATPQ